MQRTVALGCRQWQEIAGLASMSNSSMFSFTAASNVSCRGGVAAEAEGGGCGDGGDGSGRGSSQGRGGGIDVRQIPLHAARQHCFISSSPAINSIPLPLCQGLRCAASKPTANHLADAPLASEIGELCC